MLAGFGSGSSYDYTDAALDRLRNDYKMSEGHYVSSDAAPHADIAARMKAHAIVPKYDIEMAIWATQNFNVNLDIGYLRSNLQAIKDAGWARFTSEGLAQKQVAVLREYLGFDNYGAENGSDMYAGGQYYRDKSMAEGNYLECYYYGTNYKNAFSSAALSTPEDMGVTLMLYTTASLEMDTPALIKYIDEVIASGVKIKKLIFWCGVNSSALQLLDGGFNFLWKALNDKYHFTTEDEPTSEVTKMIIDMIRGEDDRGWYKKRVKGVWETTGHSIGGVLTSDFDVQYDAEMDQIVVSGRGSDKGRWHRYYNVKTDTWTGDWEGTGGVQKENGDLTIVDGKPA